MAYNNFPVGYPYQPNYPQMGYVQQQQNMQQQQPGGIIWVSGETGAKSYLVSPNSTVQLWDSEAQTIYLKSADGSGMPSMKILDYTIRESTGTQNAVRSVTETPDPNLYVTKDELHTLEEKIQKRLDKLAQKRQVIDDE